MHYACELKCTLGQKYEILKILLSSGGDLYQKDDIGTTPLHTLRLFDDSLHKTVIQQYCSKYSSYSYMHN